MSQENVELLRRANALSIAGERDALHALRDRLVRAAGAHVKPRSTVSAGRMVDRVLAERQRQ